MESCLIIGAGIAGLMAARTLQAQGVAVTVLDKGWGVGGRMATRRFGGATADHGAQFFTARSPRFRNLVNEWLAAGVATEWSRGFPPHTPNDGHPRYRGITGMTAVPKHLALGLDVRLGSKVEAVDIHKGEWAVTIEAGARFTAASLLLTPPVPQSLALLGRIPLPSEAQAALEVIQYDPCFALMATLAAESQIPPPGAVQLNGEPLAWIADNRQKGISDKTAVTLHAGPDFTRRHFETEAMRVAALLLNAAEAAGYLGVEQAAEIQIHRWLYSKPSRLHEERFVGVATALLPPIAFAGDAFKEARVEGAALSGMAAADWLLTQ